MKTWLSFCQLLTFYILVKNLANSNVFFASHRKHKRTHALISLGFNVLLNLIVTDRNKNFLKKSCFIVNVYLDNLPLKSLKDCVTLINTN